MKPAPWSNNFRQAVTTIALCSVSTATVGFAFGVASDPNENSFFDLSTKRSIYWAFDLIFFMVLWIIQVLHLTVTHPAVIKSRTIMVTYCLAMACLVATHIVSVIDPFDVLFSQITDEASSALLVLLCPLVFRFFTAHLVAKRADGVPMPAGGPHTTSPIFPFLMIGFGFYVVCLLLGRIVLSVWLRAAAVMFMLLACVAGLALQKRLARHVDYSLLIYMTYAASTILQTAARDLSATEWGHENLLLVLFSYRMILAAFSFLLDDLMHATFGEWQLWGTFFLRIGEALVSCTTAINTTSDWDQVAIYLASSFVIAAVKDAGWIDDLRILVAKGFCVYSAMDASVPLLQSAKTTMTSIAVALDSPSEATTTSLVPSFPSFVGVRNPAFGESKQHQPAQQKRRRWQSRITRKNVHLLHLDLQLQIGRSEQTLIARSCALLCVTMCYIGSAVWGRTLSSKVAYRPDVQMVAPWILGGSVVELLVARAASVSVLQGKLDRYRRVASALAIGSGDGKSSPSALPPLVLWSTGLPERPLFTYLVLLLVVFVVASHLGSW
ncbi:hypothetical protein BC828DRAFT_383954 [Blastocladiella britannica]|nr:hypothetical protein BC828DRAFT_383954 [Blastocladiella britannica]